MYLTLLTWCAIASPLSLPLMRYLRTTLSASPLPSHLLHFSYTWWIDSCLPLLYHQLESARSLLSRLPLHDMSQRVSRAREGCDRQIKKIESIKGNMTDRALKIYHCYRILPESPLTYNSHLNRHSRRLYTQYALDKPPI